MVVRFTPEPAEEQNIAAGSHPTIKKLQSSSDGYSRDGDALAEVIDIRSRLLGRGLGRGLSAAATNGAETPEGAGAQGAGALVGGITEIAGDDDSAGRGLDVQPIAEVAVRLLARKALSAGELGKKLYELEYSEAEVMGVLADFEQSLYLDDLGLARVLVTKLHETKSQSTAQIKRSLKQRLFTDVVIEEALAEVSEEAEFELLQAAAVKKARSLRGLEKSVQERRLLGYLMRRGWSGSEAQLAARQALANEH